MSGIFDSIRQLFEVQLRDVTGSADPDRVEHAYRLATAALLVEMSRADHDLHEAERPAVVDAVRRAFALDPEETESLVALAEVEADAATSLHQFTSLINEHLSDAQKEHVVKLMWRVAFADGRLDKYEEHLVRKVADLLHVRHRDFIRLKLAVESETRGKQETP